MTKQVLPAHGGAFTREKTGALKCIRKPTEAPKPEKQPAVPVVEDKPKDAKGE